MYEYKLWYIRIVVIDGIFYPTQMGQWWADIPHCADAEDVYMGQKTHRKTTILLNFRIGNVYTADYFTWL